MNLARTPYAVGFASLALLGIALTACGGRLPETTDNSGGGTRVGIFVDNAFGDGDFFDQAAKAEAPLEDAGATVNTYEGQLQAQNFEPLLQDAAADNDIVFVLGFEAIDALADVADEDTDTTFVFIDGTVDSDQVVSAVFRTAEGCSMAGALAATVNQRNDSGVAGFIGGVNSPVVTNCESGFEQGVALVDKSQRMMSQYVGSFVDPAKGEGAAMALQGKGANAVFAYAGLSGAGAFDAAKSGTAIAPIGIVADKSHLAPGKSPGSLEMGVDNVILQLTDEYEHDELEPGSQHEYGFKEGGWKMLYNDELLSSQQISALDALEAKIIDGKVEIR